VQNLWKSVTETLAVIRQALGKEIMSHTHKSKLAKSEKGKTCEEQSNFL
jgi:hypothetical protein